MISLATALKEEISTLARREVRRQTAATDRAAVRCARELATLKHEVQALEHGLASLGAPPSGLAAAPKKTGGRVSPSPQAAKQPGAASASAKPSARGPFSSEALKTHRESLGLSAENYGKLLGVSALSIYNWERGKARPRQRSVDAWMLIQRIGKREAAKRLASLKAAEPKSDSRQAPTEK